MSDRSTARSFVVTAFGFVAPLLVLFAGLEVAMRSVPNTYALKRDLLDGAGRSATVLVVGSSHEVYGVRAAELGRPAISLANSSQSTLLDVQLVELALDTMPRLETVVIGLSYFSFGYRLEASPESWRAGFYQHYFGIHEPTPAIRLPQLGDLSVAALYDPAQMVAAWRNPLPLDPEDLGWERAEESGGALLRDDAVAAARVTYHESMIDDAVRAETVAELVRLLRALERRHVRAVFVSMPEHRLYREHLREATLRRNEQDLATVRAAVPTPWIDLRADARFEDVHFVNHDHLDVLGATEATRILRAALDDVAP
jgi:hypothetical protein